MEDNTIIKQLEYKALRYMEASKTWQERYSNLLIHGKDFDHLFYVQDPNTHGGILLVYAKTKAQVVDIVNKYIDSFDWVSQADHVTFEDIKEICFDENPILDIVLDY